MELQYSTVETTLHEDNMVKTYSNSMDPVRIREISCDQENSQANENNVVSMMGFENHCKKEERNTILKKDQMSDVEANGGDHVFCKKDDAVKQNNLQNKNGKRRSGVAQMNGEYVYHKKIKKTDATETKYTEDTYKEIQAADQSIQSLHTFHDEMRPLTRWRIERNTILKKDQMSDVEANGGDHVFCKKDDAVKQNNLQNKNGKRRSGVAQMNGEYVYHKKIKKTDATETKYTEDTYKEIQAADQSIQSLHTFHDEMRPLTRWRIDSYGWNRYLEEKDASESKAIKLLGDRILPDKDILNKIMQEKEKVISPNVKRELLGSICMYIRRLSPLINDVWAAYRTKTGQPLERTDVVFVIHTSKKIEGEWEFETYQVCKNDITDTCKLENEAIYKYEQTGDYLTTEMAVIKAFIKKNARRLMQKHSNLTKISPSCMRSSGYQTTAAHMENIPCIALYVQIKGLVPFNEEPFDRTITDMPFDVREGVFTLCGKPDDLHQNVKMGCEIDSGYGTDQGTVGPFVQLENYSDTYFLTSAHVALDKKQMEGLKKSDVNYIYYGKTGHNIFQPPESKTVSNTNSRYPLGKIVLAVYKEGNEDEAGMELALVQVNEDRLPNDGSFPGSGFHFSSGEILKREKLMPTSRVFKFGCISGLTEGRYVDDCTAVRTTARGNAVSVTLNNQIKIVSLDSSKPFGEQGDSGSLVFAVDNGECRAVGIFEGQLDQHNFMVTPIEDAINFVGNRLSYHRNEICQSTDRLQFNVVQLPFERHPVLWNQTCNTASMLTDNVEHSLDTVKSELRDTRDSFKRYFDNRFDTLERLIINRTNQN
ncbi:uncharacterized protein LOC132715783 isoform X3 [Ruditapes philippinarum]|uniref:uncharacterized protein LOC132715783 isoform X3 n=1 Tax=Ruditapes philippinarum TaxID=129788 RepID=UPI00295BFA67|nr:uncharacterized protein LOC132715783 isoform X3 [Ruditapes philippinarum]